MSLKKIAQACGTSLATVSRVLNTPDYHCKDKKLEEKIWECARAYDYTPNTAAQNLKSGKAKIERPHKVDLFLARDFNLEHDSFFQELYLLLREELLRQGCHIGNLYTLPDISHFMQHPAARVHDTTEGIILLGKCSRELRQYFKKFYPAIVGIDRNPTDFEYDEIFCNGTTAATIAMEHLFSLGHTRIGYVGDCSFETRYVGYYQSLMTHKIPFDYAKILPASQTSEGGYGAMHTYLKQNPDTTHLPTAFFCANDCTAIGVLEALKEKRDYKPAIISIDNVQESMSCSPMLTTIAIPSKEMAHHAVTLLLDRLHGQHTDPIRMELPCRLIIRESCINWS